MHHRIATRRRDRGAGAQPDPPQAFCRGARPRASSRCVSWASPSHQRTGSRPNSTISSAISIGGWTTLKATNDHLAGPDITDPTVLAAARLIYATTPAAYFTDASLYAWLGLEALRIWLDHGPSHALVGPAAQAAFAAVGLREDYVAAYRAREADPARWARPAATSPTPHGRASFSLVSAAGSSRSRTASTPFSGPAKA